MRVLADTSIWIDHIRRAEPGLTAALRAGQMLIHPFVIGEIAMGSIATRAAVLSALANVRNVRIATHEEVLGFIESHRLFGIGIGYVDAHLLASSLLTPDVRLWTRDRRLAAAADRLDVGYPDADAHPAG